MVTWGRNTQGGGCKGEEGKFGAHENRVYLVGCLGVYIHHNSQTMPLGIRI